jgi:predicted HicB family RNase H-like nuclease
VKEELEQILWERQNKESMPPKRGYELKALSIQMDEDETMILRNMAKMECISMNQLLCNLAEDALNLPKPEPAALPVLKRFTLRINESTHLRLKEKSKRDGMTMKDMLFQALEEKYL